MNLKARIDFHMEVGAEIQRVEVLSQVALLNTDEATLGQVVNTRRVEELPLNGRNVGALGGLAARRSIRRTHGTDRSQ